MLWQFLLRRDIIIDNKLSFVEWAKWFEDVDFLLQFQCYAHRVYVFKDTWGYRYFINPTGAMRNSKYEDRLLCSVRLSANMLSRHFPDVPSRKYCEAQSSISITWCLREADKTMAKSMYSIIHQYLPLRIAGTYKQKIQIVLLNTSFILFKLIFKK